MNFLILWELIFGQIAELKQDDIKKWRVSQDTSSPVFTQESNAQHFDNILQMKRKIFVNSKTGRVIQENDNKVKSRRDLINLLQEDIIDKQKELGMLIDEINILKSKGNIMDDPYDFEIIENKETFDERKNENPKDTEEWDISTGPEGEIGKDDVEKVEKIKKLIMEMFQTLQSIPNMKFKSDDLHLNVYKGNDERLLYVLNRLLFPTMLPRIEDIKPRK